MFLLFSLHLQIHLDGTVIGAALQYLPTNGHGTLLDRLRDLQVRVHGDVVGQHFDAGRYDLVTCNGSQDGLSKSLEMMANIGDSVVVEDHTFFATLSILDPLKAKYVTVEMDRKGNDLRSQSILVNNLRVPGPF